MVNEVAGNVRCPRCGTINASTSSFCAACGAPLGGATGTGPSATTWPIASTAPGAPWAGAPAPQPIAPAPDPWAQGPYAASPGNTAGMAPQQAGAAWPYPGTPGWMAEPNGAGQVGFPGAMGLPGAPGQPGNLTWNTTQNIQNNINNVMVNAPLPYVVVDRRRGVALPVRVLWFLFIGLWLGLLSTIVGWLLCVTVIGLPIGLFVMNRLPAIMTLHTPATSTQLTIGNGITALTVNLAEPQHGFLARAVYFGLIGWWFSLLWLLVAWSLVALAVPTLGLSLAPAFMMFNRVPQVMTLRVQ